MTERMDNALRHIETSVDVDEWAKQLCRKTFKAWDEIKEQVTKIKRTMKANGNSDYQIGYMCALLSFEDMISDTVFEIEKSNDNDEKAGK